MTTIADLISRVAKLLQDDAHEAFSADEKRRAVLEEMMRLARQHWFGQIRWVQGMADQGRYPLAPETLAVEHAAYDGIALYEVSQDSLRRGVERWQQQIDQRPSWFTQEKTPLALDSDQRRVPMIEVSPKPAYTGADLTVLPPLPMGKLIEGNFLLFEWVDPQSAAADEVEIDVHEACAMVVIYRAAAQLSGQDGDYQELTRQKACAAVADLLATVLYER